MPQDLVVLQGGLAGATAVSASINCLLLYIVLHRRGWFHFTAKLAGKIGRVLPVIVDEVGEPDEDGDIGATARSQADAPEIDGQVFLRNVPATLKAGDFANVLVEDADAHDLYGVVAP